MSHPTETEFATEFVVKRLIPTERAVKLGTVVRKVALDETVSSAATIQDDEEVKDHAAANTITGALAGGAAGSVFGLIVPVLGTLAGSAAGAVIGAGLSAWAQKSHNHS